jgi:thiol-disulfide isomerase/thioredoxin
MSDVSPPPADDPWPELDAPTTLPTVLDGTPRPSTAAERLGGIVAEPRRAFRALVDDDRASFFEPLGVFAVVVLALHAAETFRLLALLGEAPLVVVRRLLDLVLRVGAADLGVAAVSAVVVAVVARLLGKRPYGAAVATAFLLVPLALLKAGGGLLAHAGLDLWWLPHRAVDSAAILVDGHRSWGRFAIKCVVAYGPGLAVLLDWLRRTAAGRGTPHPRAVVARRGLAGLLVVVAVLVAAAAIDVLRRADTLRPRLAGDAFPSVPLRALPLPGRTTAPASPLLPPSTKDKRRVDLLDVAALPTTKVLVVDFWASWCGPCRRSLPELSALAREHADRGVIFVGVNREPHDLPAAQKAWADLAPAFPSLVDDRGLGERLGLTSLPSSFLVDHAGRIRHLHLGLTSTATLRDEIAALLREADAATDAAAHPGAVDAGVDGPAR